MTPDAIYSLIPFVHFPISLCGKPMTGSHLGDTNNPYFYLWIIASLVSSCYAYFWDVKMDWGFFEVKSGDHKFLREEIVYSSSVNRKLYLK